MKYSIRFFYVKNKAFAAIMIFFLCFLSGCSIYSAIPVTLKEVKDYTVGQQKSYSYSLNEVLVATCFCLKKAGFSIVRIENFNQKGLVHGNCEDTSIKFSLDAVTPNLTKISSKIYLGSGFRDYSSEKTLFNNIETFLQRGTLKEWSRIIKGMSTVYISPDVNSPAIAYILPGTNQKQGEWVSISLMDGYSGYVIQ